MAEGLRDALGYAVELSAPQTITVDGRPYAKQKLHPVEPPAVEPILVHSLGALVDYLGNSKIPENSPFQIHVADYRYVHLTLPHHGEFSAVSRFVTAQAYVVSLDEICHNYAAVEDFLVLLNTLFVKDAGDHRVVRECVSSLAADAELHLSDDGFSQSATFKTGIKRVGTGEVPNPVMLAPYATFTEIEQPLRPFLLRLKRVGDKAIGVCLHPVADVTWKTKCVTDIVEFLRSKEVKVPVF